MSSKAIDRLTSRSRCGWLCIVFVNSERASYHESGAECSNEFPEPARNWVDVRKKSRSGKSVRTFRALFAQHGTLGPNIIDAVGRFPCRIHCWVYHPHQRLEEFEGVS